MIEVKNLSEFDRAIQAWFDSVGEAAAEAAVGLAHEAFESVLENSPQYSGDFVANWKVGKTVDGLSTQNAIGGMDAAEPYKRGDTPAMSYARSQVNWPNLVLGESIYLFNNAHHDEPYALKIEAGTIKLRPVNEGADHVVRRAALTLSFNYANIGPVQMDGLRKFNK